jgi:membrane protein YqaA with SNARE-associated domain
MENFTPHKPRLERVNETLKPLLKERYSLWILGAISFVESALPIPLITDPFMVAYIIAHRHRTVIGVVVTIATSLLGGLAAYLVAAFFTSTILNLTPADTLQQFNDLAARFSDSTLALGFLGAITPVPFTLAAVVAGAIQGNVFLFLIGAFLGRLIRYSITAYLTYHFGREALKIAERNIWPITAVAVLVAGIYIWYIM